MFPLARLPLYVMSFDARGWCVDSVTGDNNSVLSRQGGPTEDPFSEIITGDKGNSLLIFPVVTVIAVITVMIARILKIDAVKDDA